MSIPLSLSGKVALITGGSRGIGAAAVRMFVHAGARVLFNYEKAKAPSEQLVKELGQENCAAMACNLSGTETAQALVAAAVKRFGRLDILVANHGVWPPEDAPIDKMSDAQWRSTMAINLDSVFALIKHSVAQMKKQGKSGAAAGHIVLVSSTAGQRGEAFHCDYAATKGALISMVKGLSTELARDAIYVNTVAPGLGGYRHVGAGPERSQDQRPHLFRHPTGTGRQAGGNRRAHPFSVLGICRLHHR